MTSSIPALWLILVAIITLVIAVVACACEVAFQQSSIAKADDLVEEERRNAHDIRLWMENKYRCASVMRTAKVIAQAFFTVCLTVALADLNMPWYLLVPLSLLVAGGAIILAVSILAVQIGRRQPEGTLVVLSSLIRPVLRIADILAPVHQYVTGLRPASPLTDAEARHEMAEDLREIVDELGENENLDIADEDRTMLRAVFELGMTLVREVMTPRTDMITITTDAPVDEALTQFVHSGFSRIPVVGHDTDDVRGILYLKDVVARLHAHLSLATSPVHTLMRDATFIPEMKLADDLLRDMQRDRVHMALVVDEWGGIAGVVTIEDLVEEIVGEVADEHDHAEAQPEEIEPGRWRIPARLGIDELGELFDVELDDDDVDSAGGLLNKLLGKVTEPGDEASTHGIHLRAEHSQGRKHQIYKLMAWKAEEVDDEHISD